MASIVTPSDEFAAAMQHLSAEAEKSLPLAELKREAAAGGDAAVADLRRELSDSKAAVAEREELLSTFAICSDSQRAWLLLEDYFEKLSLSRNDFPSPDWWPRPCPGR